jgi:hypothetical protein
MMLDFATAYSSGLKLNSCPPIEASYINPRISSVSSILLNQNDPHGRKGLAGRGIEATIHERIDCPTKFNQVA